MTLVPQTQLDGGKRRRVKNYNERRGTRTGFSVPGAFLFGGVFVATGMAIALIGLHVIPVDPADVHAPYWVIVMCGVCFGGGGLTVWTMGVTQHRDERRRRAGARLHAGSPALRDRAWDPRGYTPPRWGRAVRSIAFAGFFALFLSVFNWWAWGGHGPWGVKAIVVLFDLVLALVWWKAALAVGRAIKFGGSRLVFAHFPYRMDEPVVMRWMPPHAITRAERGSFTFRCLEEYYEERGTGRDRNRWLVHDELCAETQSFDRPQAFAPGHAVEFRFELPAGARATKLAADRPVFWEFEVKLSMPGLDFEEWYLVPVYER
jgi:hypothetical protein